MPRIKSQGTSAMNATELVAKLSETHGVSKAQAKSIVDDFLKDIVFGASATMASVVIIRPATEAALSSIGSSCCLSLGAWLTALATTSRLPAATAAWAL